MADLCPLEGRRTTTELVIKLLVVHFTTLTAFFHLLRLRHDRLTPTALLFFLVCPLIIPAQIGLGLFIILLFNIHHYVLKKRTPDWEYSLNRPLAWLLGRYQPLARVPTTEQLESEQDGDKAAPVPSELRLFLQGLGHVLLVGVFLAQCAGAIALYARRRAYARDSVTVIDDTVVQLAIGGLGIGLATLWGMLNLRFGRLDGPRASSCSIVDIYMLGLGQRDGDMTTKLGLDFWHLIIPRVLVIIPLLVALLLAVGETEGICRWLLQALCFVQDQDADWVSSLMPIVRQFNLLLFAFTFYAVDWDEPVAKNRVVSLVLKCLIGVVPCLLLTLLFALGVTWPNRFVRMAVQLQQLEPWPVDIACPMLWKDSAAEYVWWLA